MCRCVGVEEDVVLCCSIAVSVFLSGTSYAAGLNLICWLLVLSLLIPGSCAFIPRIDSNYSHVDGFPSVILC